MQQLKQHVHGGLALIVPYRGRFRHLVQFVPHLEGFLQGAHLRIAVIEQADARPFNRGKLLNIGFSLFGDSDRICFHDVDMLPLDQNCDYLNSGTTVHLAGRAEQFGYRMPYPEYLGGVLLPKKEDFQRVNGFSNQYWGWGAEDDDLYARFVMAEVRVEHKPGRYRSLPHEPGTVSEANQQRLRRTIAAAAAKVTNTALKARIGQVQAHFGDKPISASDYREDGLSTLNYQIVTRCSLRNAISELSTSQANHEVVQVKL
jgi:hypothetical protein